jgi:hypothetical protein
MLRFLSPLLFLLAAAVAQAQGVASLTSADATAGLREALSSGAAAAIAQLGAENGFLNDGRVRIPLPPSLQKAEKLLKTLGLRKQADELVTAMNRAAEAAVPHAKALVADAVKQMTVQDAKAILTGGDDSVTQYFRAKTAEPLAIKFQPIVKAATDKVGLAEKYNALAAQGKSLGLVKEEDASIDRYVTRKALDGLYAMIGEEERKLRANPLQAGSGLLRKVFGALK